MMNERLEIILRGMEFRRFTEGEFAEIRKKYSLKKAEIDVLCFLGRSKGMDTPTDIHRCLKMNRGQVSQAIDSLCRKGYLLVVPDREDRRMMHYSVNTSASDVIEGISIVRKKMEEKLFSGVSDEELKTLLKIMDKIKKNMHSEG